MEANDLGYYAAKQDEFFERLENNNADLQALKDDLVREINSIRGELDNNMDEELVYALDEYKDVFDQLLRDVEEKMNMDNNMNMNMNMNDNNMEDNNNQYGGKTRTRKRSSGKHKRSSIKRKRSSHKRSSHKRSSIKHKRTNKKTRKHKA
jgi:hypothetical protein